MADQPVNTDGAAAHEADYRPLENNVLKGASKEIVLRMAVNVLVQCFSVDVLQAIYQDGFDKFHALAQEQWHVHEFTTDDYRHAFEVVEVALKDRLIKQQGVIV